MPVVRGVVLVIRVGLLAAAVVGAVTKPRGLPSWLVPLVATVVSLAVGAMSPSSVLHALRPLAAPIGFLLAAIPFAVLLDRAGYFRELASVFGAGKALLPGLWALGAVTVAVLNLDAAVVLLTPLYVAVARSTGSSPRSLGSQPVILALLASSFLPVSNLTNLIAATRTGEGPVAFLVHLGIPGLTSCVVGYWCYRRYRPAGDPVVPAGSLGPTVPPPGRQHEAAPEAGIEPRGHRTLLFGSTLVGTLLVGFVLGPGIGLEPWEVVLAGDAVLMVATRRVPLGSIPWGTAVVAGGLGALATSAASGLSLAVILGPSTTGPLATLRIAAVAAVGANVVNNLPALIVSLPFVSGPRSCALWPLLLGVNAGPGLLVTGSLASLLWVESMTQLGLRVRAREFFTLGLRVSLPAAMAALAALVVTAPVVGCR